MGRYTQVSIRGNAIGCVVLPYSHITVQQRLAARHVPKRDQGIERSHLAAEANPLRHAFICMNAHEHTNLMLTLPQQEALADLKAKMTSRMDWGNRYGCFHGEYSKLRLFRTLELDLVPRNSKGEVIDIDQHSANVIELFRVHQIVWPIVLILFIIFMHHRVRTVRSRLHRGAIYAEPSRLRWLQHTTTSLFATTTPA